MTDLIYTQPYQAPCGELLLGSYGNRLCLCNWSVSKHPGRVDARLQHALHARYEMRPSDVTLNAAAQLDEYFAGRRTAFDIPLLMVGTEFQQRVWQQLLTIAYGTTCSYGELARQIGTANAVRAVANANGANALSLFIPCHRIVGSNHTLTGYAGGLAAKRFLLQLEQEGGAGIFS